MKTILTVAAFVFSMPLFAQTQIGGNVMPNVMKVGSQYLKMNGGGIREKMFIDLYVAVLYLESKTTSAQEILSADKPMAVKIKIISGMVDNDNFEEAIREGFDKSTKNNTEPYKERLEKLIEIGFKEDIKTNDIFDLVYHPGTGCQLIKNNKVLVTVDGLDFKKALFGIWLGEDPADGTLKKKMLGK
ncbi:chalcone isomerase family protein [Crocinitomix algicola]|uniref:chalcone isomerase family protein n=1 Tax=Crocinitomix algicola TaxID=1740263 RepID=UPI000872365C|nr:chalcone isomerase family protein [Crocinitomix algicola]